MNGWTAFPRVVLSIVYAADQSATAQDSELDRLSRQISRSDAGNSGISDADFDSRCGGGHCVCRPQYGTRSIASISRGALRVEFCSIDERSNRPREGAYIIGTGLHAAGCRSATTGALP